MIIARRPNPRWQKLWFANKRVEDEAKIYIKWLSYATESARKTAIKSQFHSNKNLLFDVWIEKQILSQEKRE